MTDKVKIWLKAIPDGWKFFTAIIGAILIIAKVAIWVDHWKDKGVSQANVIEYLQKSDHDQDLYNKIRDSIEIKKWNQLDLRLKFISDSIRLTLNNQQTLTNAVGTMGTQLTKTVPDLFKLMGGLQFKVIETIQTKSVYPGASIKIIQIDTTKR